jgi:hypothetical protein
MKADTSVGIIPSPKLKYPGWSGEEIQRDQKMSDNQSLKLELRHNSLFTNARVENLRVMLSPSQSSGTRAPRIRSMRRWDLIRL